MSETRTHERDPGRFYEDFHVGQRIVHPLGRTVLAADNSWFSLLTQNQNPIHIDRHHSERTPFGKPLVNSCLTLALATGQSVNDLTRNVLANLGWDDVRLPAPLFEGDTLYSESEVLSTRESRSRPEAGIVTVRTRGKNQDGEVVIEFSRTFLIWKRADAPAVPAMNSSRVPVTPTTAALDEDPALPLHGVDFSGARGAGGRNAKIWIASWFPQRDSVELQSGRDGRGFDRAGLARKIIEGGGVWVIDFPFGPPAALASGVGWSTWEEYLCWCASKSDPTELRDELRETLRGGLWSAKREIDRQLKTTWFPFFEQLYRQTITGARDLLGPLERAGRDKACILPFHERAEAERGLSVVIEGFPGWTLRRHCLPSSGYKRQGIDAEEKRRCILNFLIECGVPISDADRSRAIADTNGDAVDALVLLLAARDASTRPAADWRGKVGSNARIEGWFFD